MSDRIRVRGRVRGNGETGAKRRANGSERKGMFQLTATTALAGTLAFAGLVGGTAMPGGMAQAQVVNVCTGLSLDSSVLRDRLVPLLQTVVTPIEATVDPLVGNVTGLLNNLLTPILGLPTIPALNLDVSSILANAQTGAPLGIQALGPSGVISAADCNIEANALQLDGTQGISIGGNQITGLGRGGAAPAFARTVDSIAFGDNAQTGLNSAGAIALGLNSNVGANAGGSIALGAGANVSAANSVAIGAGTAALRGAQTGYAAIGVTGAQASIGEVAIGNRTLTGLAAGTAATDAVNVAQLTGVANAVGSTAGALGGGASYDPVTGVFTPPSYTVQGADRPTVGAALTALDGQVSTNTTNITNLTNGTVGLVQQATAASPITVAAATGGTSVGFAGTAGARVLTGVGTGAVTAASTDAVTGAQLFATNAAVGTLGTGLTNTAALFGAGTAYDPATGTFTPPAFVLNAVNGVGTETFATVDGALGNLDDRTLENTTDITNLANNIGNGTVGLVQQLGDGTVTVAGATGGTTVTFAGSAGPRTLTGVADGTVAAGSTAAVTGNQLFATNTAVLGLNTGVAGTAGALGGGASYDPATGIFTGPSYAVQGTTQTTVGGAIGALDGQVTTNTTNIANLTNGTVGLVQQLTAGGPITVGAGVAGDTLAIAGSAGTRTLTGVTDGTVAAGSTAAVTGNQLFATNTAVGTLGTGLTNTATLFGAGASYDPATGTFSPPAYILADVSGTGTTTFNDVGGALGNLDTRTTALAGQIGSGTIGLVQQLTAGGPITIGATVAGDTVDIAGTAGDRTLTGVEAGALTATSTDAVNGAQLLATNTNLGGLGAGTAAAIGGGAGYNPATGVFTAPSFSLEAGATVVDNVGAAIGNLDLRTTANTTDIVDLRAQIGSGGVGLVRQATPTSNLTVGAATGGGAVDFTGTGGGRVLTGLAAGSVAAGSTDAVTGDQLAATNVAVGTLGTGLAANAAALGGGAGYDPATGIFTGPSYTVQGTTQTTVGGAIGALDGQVTTNTTNIANLTNQIGSGTVGLVQQAAPGADLTVGAATNGDAVRFNQTGGGTRLVTGLTAGSVAAGSSDAVTGGQAFATGQSIASALGGGAALAADGTISAPSYSIGGTVFNDAGSAFAELDDSVTALQNQVGAFDPDGQLAFLSVNTTSGPARATGTESIASGGGAFASGTNTAAYGSNAGASGTNASAFGAGSNAAGDNSSAYGAGASAGFANSSAFGAGATATRANQMAFGTAGNTYTMAGLTSDASRAAQSGPVDLVTTDANGNLASLPLSDFFSGVSAIDGRLGGIERKLDRQSDGIAIAMALGSVNLPADRTFAITGSVGYFDDTAAFGVGAIGQIADNWYLNGGVGIGTESGTLAGRAGLTFAW